MYFLKRFRCFLERIYFEVFTDNQFLRHFFAKPHVSRREALRLNLFALFGISDITISSDKVHVLGDTHSCASHAPEMPHVSNLPTPKVYLLNGFQNNYEQNTVFGPIANGLRGELPSDFLQEHRFMRLLSLFELYEGIIYHVQKPCVPRKNVRDMLYLAHDCRVTGQLSYSKTLERLENFHWKHKSSYVKYYCAGCRKCQGSNDSRLKSYGTLEPLENPSRCCESIASDPIMHIPLSSDGHDAIITFVDIFSKQVHITAAKTTYIAIDTAVALYNNVIHYHSVPDTIASDQNPEFTAKLWVHLMKIWVVQLRMLTILHPRIKGSSEIMNRMLENCIRCFCNINKNNWDELLVSVEISYNSCKVDQLQSTSFKLYLGWHTKCPLDCPLATAPTVKSVNGFRRRLKNSCDDAQFFGQRPDKPLTTINGIHLHPITLAILCG